MVAIKTHQANAYLSALDRLPPAVLLYGGDAGLVAERASQLAKRLAERDDPPGEIIRLDDASLEEDPGRMFVELQTAPMFGGRKVLRTIAGRRVTAAQLKPLVESGDLQGFLIVEAGNLRPDEALRALFEKSPAAAAIACFPDEARDLEAVMREAFAPGQHADHARCQAPAAGAARRRPRPVAGRDRQARALCARQEHDRGERCGGCRRRRGRAGARPHRHGRSRGAWRGGAGRVRPQRCLGREPAVGDRRAAAPLPAPAPHARCARHGQVHGRRGARRATAAALQATRGDRAAVPRLDPAPAHRRARSHRRRRQGGAPQLRAGGDAGGAFAA